MKSLTYNDRVATYKDTEINQEFSMSITDGTVAMALSGGLDSTTFMFFICRYIIDLKLENKIKIKPVMSVEIETSHDLYPALNLVDDISLKYPNINIDDFEMCPYKADSYDEEYDIEYKGIQNKVHDTFFTNLYKNNDDLTTIIQAHTGWPPEDIVKHWGIHKDDWIFNERKYEVKRNIYIYTVQGAKIYRPMTNNNKMLVASLFKFLNIDNKYITETFSCTAPDGKVVTSTKPCQRCPHCWEKKWAFGQF
tara:strand:- start:342 stop:1094 length:753 start_codon:yes stop_codon:yes gene_type:complete